MTIVQVWTAAIVGGVLGVIIVLIILLVTPLVVLCTLKRISSRKSRDLNDDDVAHCSVNPSYDTVHSTTTNKHNIVYDEVHTTPSRTDNPAYGTQ